MPSSITRLTALDHDRMLRLLRRASGPGPSQARWRDELVHLVRAYLGAVGAALAPDGVPPAGPTATALDELRRAGDELDEAARTLGELPVTDARLPDSLARLDRARERYATLLRDQVLAPLDSVTARKEMRRLGGVYQDERDLALREEGGAEPPPRRLDLSRAELYEMAKRAGIEGRSAMSRQDLIIELQRRQQPR